MNWRLWVGNVLLWVGVIGAVGSVVLFLGGEIALLDLVIRFVFAALWIAGGQSLRNRAHLYEKRRS